MGENSSQLATFSGKERLKTRFTKSNFCRSIFPSCTLGKYVHRLSNFVACCFVGGLKRKNVVCATSTTVVNWPFARAGLFLAVHGTRRKQQQLWRRQQEHSHVSSERQKQQKQQQQQQQQQQDARGQGHRRCTPGLVVAFSVVCRTVQESGPKARNMTQYSHSMAPGTFTNLPQPLHLC